ncbi:MAG: methyltransferase [Clostridia bacterium]|nr:methyltransferase [Clostridia bacterium]
MNKGERADAVNGGLTLLQNEGHLAFGTDALLLSAFVGKAKRAAELGAGNGIVSLLCAARGKCGHIDAYEIQNAVADLCQKNVEKNDLTHLITVINGDLRQIEGEKNGSYDAVFSNPPYMKADAGRSCATTEKQMARHEMAGDIYDFCAAASRLLAFGADFYCVYRPDRLCDLFDAMRRADIEPKVVVTVCQSPRHAPSMVLVKGKKGGKAGLYFTPVFFIKEQDHNSPDYAYVLEKGEFHERFRTP